MNPNLENVNGCPSVNSTLLVSRVQDSALASLIREKSGGKVELETACNSVFYLNLGTERVRGRPSLSEGKTVLAVGVLRLDIAVDSVRLRVLRASNLEGDIGRGLRFHLK